MFSFHIYFPSQLPPYCNVRIVVILIYCSIMVIFISLFGACTILVDPFPSKCLEFMRHENDSIRLAHLVVYNIDTLLSMIRDRISHLCLFFLAFLLYYVSIFVFLALNSRVAIVLFSFKFNSYCNRVCYSLLVKLLWDISSWLACNVLPMATFHVVRKLIFTILVGDSIVVKVIKNVLCAMFPFWKGSMHTFKDFAYMEDVIVSSPIY